MYYTQAHDASAIEKLFCLLREGSLCTTLQGMKDQRTKRPPANPDLPISTRFGEKLLRQMERHIRQHGGTRGEFIRGAVAEKLASAASVGVGVGMTGGER